MAAPSEYRVFAVGGIPEVVEGDDLAKLIDAALTAQETPLEAGDVLVVTQKIVSKAEGRVVPLEGVTAGLFAQDWADDWEKDARAVELVLQESKRIVRMTRGLILSETRHGWVCANAGVDQSNVGGGDAVALLPIDSSASALAIRQGLVRRGQVDVPVIVSDTFGRPWRNGLTNVAIGVSGMNPIRSYVGEVDAEGYDLKVTEMAIVDELASAAEPVMNKLDAVPVAVVRGLDIPIEDYDHSALVRPAEMDLFR
ncbi:MAG: coenzyme F420-0:L-glutamate ligase [Chloroflexi bacterium]|nr:coenzyme F420-0:L-glutamate ligase [Chloroflexota bacterium]MCY3696474.1 coenzyme F420-0:L-glutamate ligase [Chloroflexota bacterium]MXX32383.1 coenzyme F420-0:L-glutamate ligase [Chloroflexota bacterium]MYD16219.1 coenzyme F420-0:L-glutamate ligase [Chloroflexota bacterium]